MTGGKTDVFGLRVKGESMIDALVADGDLVIMEPADNVNDGDMVAAFLEDREEVTLKHFQMSNGTVTLPPGQLDHGAHRSARRERVGPWPGRRSHQDRLSYGVATFSTGHPLNLEMRVIAPDEYAEFMTAAARGFAWHWDEADRRAAQARPGPLAGRIRRRQDRWKRPTPSGAA